VLNYLDILRFENSAFMAMPKCVSRDAIWSLS